MKRLAILAAVPIAVLAVWGGRSTAATADTAAASVDPAIALVGDPVTFTSTNPCTVNCALIWRRPDIGLDRFGGVIVGRGDQITLTFDAPGTYQVTLDLAETCVGTTRLVCHSTDSVFVEIVTSLPDPAATTTVAPDPTTTTTVAADPATTTTVAADTATTTTAAPDPTTTTAAPDPTTTTTVAPDVSVPPDPTEPALVAPSDLSVERVQGRNRLTWTNPESSATSLTVERCEGAGCTDFSAIAVLDPSTTSFIESHQGHGGSDFAFRIAVSDSITTVYSNIGIEVDD